MEEWFILGDLIKGHVSLEQDEEDVYFDDESAEVVISSLRLSDEQDRGSNDSMFGNKDWFAFPDDNRSKQPLPPFLISPPFQRVEDEQVTNVVSQPHSSGGSSSDDKVVVGEDEDLADTATSPNSSASQDPIAEQQFDKGPGYSSFSSGDSTVNSIEDILTELEKLGLSDNLFLFDHAGRNIDLFASKSVDWEGSLEHAESEGASGRVCNKETVPSDAPVEKVDGLVADIN